MQITADTDPNNLLRDATLIKRATSIGNADVYSVTLDGQQALLKTYRDRPLFIRLLFGRRALRNEYRMLCTLHGVEGIPQAYALLGKDTLISEFIPEATPVVSSRSLDPQQYPPRSFFKRLKSLVEHIHAKGISHGDIRRMNVLRSRDDQPHIIDFATAVSVHGRAPRLRQMLFRMFSRADDFATAKIVYTYYPDLLSEQERKRLENPPWYLQAGRFLRKRVYRKLIKQRRWKQRMTKAKTAIRSIGRNHSEETSP